MKKSILIACVSLMASFIHPMWLLVFLGATIAFLRDLYAESKYKKETYYKDTGISYWSMRKDSGRYGEYLIYNNLKHREGQDGKFLFNLYLPTDSGKTTEIDVVFLCRKGVFVFESKNYSGWIFGKESQQNWTQTLPKGRSSHKEHFYNPIRQNAGHIKNLERYVNETDRFYSVIAFSDRCTFKALEVESQNVFVLHRREVEKPIEAVYQYCEDIMTQAELDTLYETLYPFTQVNEEIKVSHIETVAEIRGETEYPTSKKTLEQESEKEEPCSQQAEMASGYAKKICPLCGNELIVRTASRGVRAGKMFFGCKNYPRCKYVENID